MEIQNISLILVINPTYTPTPSGIVSMLNAIPKPPSRVPSCMGEKKRMLANNDENAATITT